MAGIAVRETHDALRFGTRLRTRQTCNFKIKTLALARLVDDFTLESPVYACYTQSLAG